MKIAQVKQMRDMDRRAIEQYGIRDELLMENAGEATYFAILENFDVAGRRFLILCGGGNNGGDGFVVARKLHSAGASVKIVMLSDPSKYKGAAKLNHDICNRLAIPSAVQPDDQELKDLFLETDTIVDAIFGTGLTRMVEGHYNDVIRGVNQSGLPVISIDIPSGIQGDTGQVMGTAVVADLTVTYGLPKTGNLLYPGFDHCGQLLVTHISFPPELYDDDTLTIATNHPVPMPERPEDAHKGVCGKVLFIAGSSRYLGAPYFAAMSFLKAGGGLAFLATPGSVAAHITGGGREIIIVPQADTEEGSIAVQNLSDLVDFSQQCDFVVLGPGMSLNDETGDLIRSLINQIEKPLLIDGDGLSAVALDTEIMKKRKSPTILTPHPGEMARLIGLSIGDIIADRIKHAAEYVKEWECHLVLKGAHTLIADPEGNIYINLSGNSGMATAGSGDVLTGTVAAMAGQGYGLTDAVRMGTFLHGFAGDLAADELGRDGMVAGDIMRCLPAAMKQLREHWHDVIQNPKYHIPLL